MKSNKSMLKFACNFLDYALSCPQVICILSEIVFQKALYALGKLNKIKN